MNASRHDSSASLQRTGSLSFGWFIQAVCFVGALLVLSLAFLAGQLFVLGVLDRLGFAPQFAFLFFNITVLLLLGGRGLAPVVKTFNRLRQAIGRTVNTRPQAVMPDRSGTPNLICKTLIIRRLPMAVSQPAADTSDERRTTNELVAGDWFSDS
jgi:hypothetical protein